jgi:hypothetical protein
MNWLLTLVTSSRCVDFVANLAAAAEIGNYEVRVLGPES